MNEEMKMVPWATDENKNYFVIFMIDRGYEKANAFVWVAPSELGRNDELAFRITTFREVVEYFTQIARPMYFGEDRSKELMDAALEILNEVPESYIDVCLNRFHEDAFRREEAAQNGSECISFEKECLEYFKKAGKEGDGLSAV